MGPTQVLARGVDALASAVATPMEVVEAMRRAAALLEAGAARACRLVALGMGIGQRAQALGGR